MKCIFSIAPVGKLEKSRTGRCPRGTGRCVCASGVQAVPGSARVRHRTPGTGRGLDPVGASGVLSPMFCVFALLSGYETGEHRTVRCSASNDPTSLHTSLSLSPLRIGRVRCVLTVSPVLRPQGDSRWRQRLDFKRSKCSRHRTHPV